MLGIKQRNEEIQKNTVCSWGMCMEGKIVGQKEELKKSVQSALAVRIKLPKKEIFKIT